MTDRFAAEIRYEQAVQAAREALAYARRCPRKYRHALAGRLEWAQRAGQDAREALEEATR